MNVSEIMTRDPAWCTPETRLRDVAQLMIDHDCGQIPVVESEQNRRPVGVVTDRDIVMRAIAKGRNAEELLVGDVMSHPAITVTPDARLEECCRMLEDSQVRRVPVVDEHGQLCGIVSQADIAQYAPERITAEVVRTVSQPTGTRD
jgi:CBS domain-containing protein